MHPNQKIKFNDWYMKIDPPLWKAANFQCMNVLINDIDNDNDNVNQNDIDNDNNNNDKNNDNDNVNVNDNDNDKVRDELFVNKPVAIGYIIVKNSEYHNLNLEEGGYIKHFGENCVEWFINEMLEIEGYMKIFFKNEIEINLDKFPKKL